MKRMAVLAGGALLLGAAAVGHFRKAGLPEAPRRSPPRAEPAPSLLPAPVDESMRLDAGLRSSLRLTPVQEQALRAAAGECLERSRAIQADRRLSTGQKEGEVDRLRMELEPRLRAILDDGQYAELSRIRAERREEERERRICGEVRRTATLFDLDGRQADAYEALVRARYAGPAGKMPPRRGEDRDWLPLVASLPGLTDAQREQIREHFQDE
jgi:hypothetical protein